MHKVTTRCTLCLKLYFVYISYYWSQGTQKLNCRLLTRYHHHFIEHAKCCSFQAQPSRNNFFQGTICQIFYHILGKARFLYHRLVLIKCLILEIILKLYEFWSFISYEYSIPWNHLHTFEIYANCSTSCKIKRVTSSRVSINKLNVNYVSWT